MSNYYISTEPSSPSLLHSRTKGSKNGIRRYQYTDGSLTPLGRVHYGVGPPRGSKSKTDKDSGSKKSGSSSKTTKRRQKAKLIASSGNVKEAIRNFMNLTDKDIQKTRERARLKRDLEREESTKSKPSKGFILGKNRKEDYSEIIESGNARKIRDNLSKLTDDEIKRGIARAQMNASLKEISNRGGTRLDRVANAAQNIGKIAAAAGTVKSTVDKFTGKGKDKDKDKKKGNGNDQNQNNGNSDALSNAIARLQRQLEETENQHRNATANSGQSSNSGNSSRPSQESISEAINRLTEVADTYDRERASARNVTPNGDRGRSSSGSTQDAINNLTRVANQYASERREREVNEAINNFLRLAEEERRNRRS